MKRQRKLISDGQAIAIGCIVGLLGGAALGVCVGIALGGFTSEMAMIVPHVALAMTVMGAWATPALVPMAPDN